MVPRCAATSDTVPSKAKPRIGVFGGAFDPPHRAHVALAEAAFKQLGLTEIRLVPTGQAPHRNQPLTDGKHRVAMLKLAFEEAGVQSLPGFSWTLDERELQRSGLSFMVDTLREIQQENPQADLFLLIGADQAQAFTSWHEWTEILNLATLVVAARESGTKSKQEVFEFERHPNARVLKLNFTLMPISATEVRSRLAQSVTEPDTLTHWIASSVAGYIAQHQLYKAA